MSTGYRPPQWSRPALTSVEADGVIYYFDAAFQIDHQQDLRHTEHPIQAGASVVDHSYLTPARVVLSIGMSDVMDSFVQGQYSSDRSKSVAAYNKFLEIQSNRTLLTLNTRLKQYKNMLLENVRASQDNTTVASLRAILSFYEVIIASVASRANSNDGADSARPDQTNTTNEGTKHPATVPSDLQKYLDLSRNGL